MHVQLAATSVLFTLNACPLANAQFGPELTALDLGLRSPLSATAVDLDGDGDLDVVAGGGAPHSEYRGQAAWIENLGAGSFTRPQVIHEGNADVDSVRHADLDGDGDEDLVVNIAPWNGLLGGFVLYRNVGHGQFERVGTVDADADAVEELQMAELDGAPGPDLLYALRSGGVWMRTGLGSFAFGPPIQLAPSSVSTAARAIDLDQDGDLDVLASSMPSLAAVNSGELEWLENLGSGTFLARSLGTVPRAARTRAVDLDSDGNIDVICAGQQGVTIFEGTGPGVWAAPSVIVGTPTLEATALDVDRDGLLDIVAIARAGRARWHRSLGASAYGPAVELDGEAALPTSLEVADLDGDGHTDLLTTVRGSDTWFGKDNVIGLHRGASSTGFEPRENLTGTLVDEPRPIETVDMDGDGDLDLLLVADPGSSGAMDGRIAWAENDGTGQFTRIHEVGESPNVREIQCVDLDQDGAMDILAISGGQTAWLRGTATGFEPSVSLGPGLGGARAADVDGDGTLDLLLGGGAGIFFRRGLGSGAFVGPTLAAAGTIRGFDVGDFDGDGIVDLVAAGVTSGAIGAYWQPGLGSGAFGPRTLISGTFFDGRAFARAVDINADGALDLVIGDGDILVSLGNGQGVFTPAASWVGTTDQFSTPSFADVDGDGRRDVVTALIDEPFSQRTLILRSTASGVQTTPLTAAGKMLGSVATGDLDGDGDIDVLTSMPLLSRVLWHRNAGSATNAFCRPTRANSTGDPGRTRATGSVNTATHDFGLCADQLPIGVVGFFLVGTEEGFAPRPGGSNGNLCLGGTLGRFVRPGEVGTADAVGKITLAVDLNQLPQAGAVVAVLPGDTWRFQLWHRDLVQGSPTSNFTDALSARFE